MKSQILEIEAAKLVLGLTVSETLPDIATQAMVAGYDSPSLVMLAGLTKVEMDEVVPFFKKALSELGISLPDNRKAVLLLAKEVAEQILVGEIPPYEGAKEIWELSLEADLNNHELDGFIYAASEWEGRPEDHALFEEGIVKQAKHFLDSQLE